MEELTSVLQGVHLPCWVVDDDGMFTWVNDAFIAMFGDRRGEYYSVLVAPESLEAAERHFEHVHAGGPVSEAELVLKAPKGGRVRIEVSSVLLEDIGLCCGAFGLAGMPARLLPRPAARTVMTPRQLEILLLLSGGASTAQIASELFITTETVRNHIRRILMKLHVHSRLAAVAKARTLGLIDD